MKLGQVLYRHMLNRRSFDFARQAGATHLVVHLTDYFAGGGFENELGDQPVGSASGWGRAGDPDRLWTAQELKQLNAEVKDAGLELAALENIDPAFWHDVLLDGPKRDLHIANVQQLIRNMGEAGIPVLGYYFSLAGVCCRTKGPYARGGANCVGMDGVDETPIPNGMVWNMIYDPSAKGGTLPATTREQLWDRLRRFLEEVVPVAEKAGVRLAAHPDDPPLPELRQTPRLIYRPQEYQKLLDLYPSRNSGLELCIGTFGEMPEGGDIYDWVNNYAAQDRIVYVHMRNVRGKAPHYRESFIDDGDVDVLRMLRILRANRFQGVIIPDHAPQMSCDAPWEAGMAFALGYLKALMSVVERESSNANQIQTGQP